MPGGSNGLQHKALPGDLSKELSDQELSDQELSDQELFWQ
jgi:hypothetical protein